MEDNNTPRDTSAPSSRHPKDVTASEARQGRRGVPVLMVLIGGLVFAALVWAIVEFYGESIRNEAQEVETGGQAPVEQSAPDDPATLPPAGQN